MKDLKRISKEMEEGEPEEVEKVAAKLGAEDEDEASLQESLPGLLNEVKRINSYIEDQNKASGA